MELRKKLATIAGLVVVLALLALAVVVSYEYGTANNPRPNVVLAPVDVSSLLEHTVADLIDERRTAMGLKTLHSTYILSVIARYQASDLGQASVCQHEGLWSSLSFGISPADRSRRLGYPGSWYGEVVACRTDTPEATVAAWWASPPHRSILVDPIANEIGVGMYPTTGGGSYWVAETGRVR